MYQRNLWKIFKGHVDFEIMEMKFSAMSIKPTKGGRSQGGDKPYPSMSYLKLI